jgi:acetylornithine deacetylase/succinyl-diaminopimelate desuccinylase-like protein
MREVHTAFDWFRKREAELFAEQLEILKVPAPPFGEEKRAQYLQERFVASGMAGVYLDEVHNVIGVLPGQSRDAENNAVLLSAHIDTVFPAGTQYQVVHSGNGFSTRIEAPGASDNAAGIVALLAMARVITELELPHAADIILVGNVGEEGEGDLRGIRHLFASPINKRIAYTLVIDGTGTEGIVTQALGSRRFEVTVHGPGGHSWQDYGRPNPINVLARAISLFQDAPVPTTPRSSVNVGMISGGTSVNTIPESATMRVDIRSAAGDEIQKLESSLRQAVKLAVNEQVRRSAVKRDQVRYEITQIGDRPAAQLDPNARILEIVTSVDMHLGIRSELRRSSTDANIPLSLGREAVSIGAGGSGAGAHTLREWYDAAGRDLALKRILLTALLLAGE